MQNGNKGPRHKTVAASQKREDITCVRQEGFQTGNREVSSRDVQRVTGNQEPDIVEVSAHSKTEEDPDRSFAVRRAGNVNPRSFYECHSTVKRKENKQDDGENLD
jgi:hypothetical protein